MSSCPKPANNSAGFTLVELMVTVVVLSIVMLVAVPSCYYLVEGKSFYGHGNKLVSAMKLAKVCMTPLGAPVVPEV